MCYIFVVIKLIKYVLVTIGKHILHITYDYKSTIVQYTYQILTNISFYFSLHKYTLYTRYTIV